MIHSLAFFILVGLAYNTHAMELTYPELHVEPSASSRLKSGAAEESKSSMRHLVPLYLSSLTTLGAGIAQFHAYDPIEDESKSSAYMGVGVGVLTLAATAYLHYGYKPYLSAYSKNRSIKGDSQRIKLRKERLAEEAMKKAYRSYRRSKWMIAVAQVGAGAHMQAKAHKDRKLGGQLTMAFALLPLVFDHFWEDNYKQHQENKKNIYAPLVGSIYRQDPRDSQYGVSLNWFF